MLRPDASRPPQGNNNEHVHRKLIGKVVLVELKHCFAISLFCTDGSDKVRRNGTEMLKQKHCCWKCWSTVFSLCRPYQVLELHLSRSLLAHLNCVWRRSYNRGIYNSDIWKRMTLKFFKKYIVKLKGESFIRIVAHGFLKKHFPDDIFFLSSDYKFIIWQLLMFYLTFNICCRSVGCMGRGQDINFP